MLLYNYQTNNVFISTITTKNMYTVDPQHVAVSEEQISKLHSNITKAHYITLYPHVVIRNKVLKDCPRLRGQLEDKKSWPWPWRLWPRSWTFCPRTHPW